MFKYVSVGMVIYLLCSLQSMLSYKALIIFKISGSGHLEEYTSKCHGVWNTSCGMGCSHNTLAACCYITPSLHHNNTATKELN